MESERTSRQEIERAYHNEQGIESPHRGIADGETDYYAYFFRQIAEVADLDVLDFGCGDGWTSFALAQRGARVTGIDISDKLIAQATAAAAARGLAHQVRFHAMAGEELALAEQRFDLVVGSAVLHHTELRPSLERIRQHLKAGGRAVFVEPMNENLLLKCWRKCTPWRRSPTERALVWDDIELVREIFPAVKLRFFCLFSILTSGLNILLPESRLIKRLNHRFSQFDAQLLKRWPRLGRYCATVVLEMVKEAPETWPAGKEFQFG